MFFRKKPIATAKSKQIAMSSLMMLMEENDILEIELLLDGAVVKIGVSSDYNQRRGALVFEKRYHIDNQEYLSPAAFSQAFSALSTRTTQTILRIDGVPPKHYIFER